jgi:hypothetical protein
MCHVRGEEQDFSDKTVRKIFSIIFNDLIIWLLALGTRSHLMISYVSVHVTAALD